MTIDIVKTSIYVALCCFLSQCYIVSLCEAQSLYVGCSTGVTFQKNKAHCNTPSQSTTKKIKQGNVEDYSRYYARISSYKFLKRYLRTIKKELGTELSPKDDWEAENFVKNVDFSPTAKEETLFNLSEFELDSVDYSGINLGNQNVAHTAGHFGTENDAESLKSAASKISRVYNNYRNTLVHYFPEGRGFHVSDPIDVEINGFDRTINISGDIRISHDDFPDFHPKIFPSKRILSDNRDEKLSIEIPLDSFSDNKSLQRAITEIFTRNALSSIYAAWNKVEIPEYKVSQNELLSAENLSSTKNMSNVQSHKKSGATYSIFLGIDKSFMKDNESLALYFGLETFLEINPMKYNIQSKPNRTTLKNSNTLGIIPMIGISTKSNWIFYTLFPIQYSTYHVKDNSSSDNIIDSHKKRIIPALGIGIKYKINNRWSLGIRYTTNLKSNIKFNNKNIKKISIDSTKVSLQFSYNLF